MYKAAFRCLFYFTLVFVCLLSGCNEEDCLSENVSYISIEFINMNSGLQIPQAFNQVNILGIEGTLYTVAFESPVFLLPINPHADKVTYIFRTINSTEQITFTYSRTPRILSTECPQEIQYQNLTIVEEETTFRGYLLNKNELTESRNFNVTIYR